MAEKEQHKDKVVTEKTAASQDSQATTETVVPRRHSQRWVIGVVVGVIVLYALLMGCGLWAFYSLSGLQRTDVPTGMYRSGMHSRFTSDQNYAVRSSDSDGLTTTTTNTTYTQTQGVITAVNNGTIVVAGGGKTQTIKTNSSTTYANDTKPAVNDTVVVTGTKDGDTITATQIAVYN